ncbi:MAG TPA: RNA polymerase sigma-70 factor [Polyangiaceae bacterium]|nr:RNA polymerase sigma-70 factor [Polyangiaceae bacterium]
MTAPDTFESLRPLLFSIAYRMLASVSDAEDIVQDAYLRYQHALERGVRVESTKSYLSALVTRLAIDSLRSARAKRESYVGQWLPEPVLGDGGDPLSDSERAETISMAFLLLLQRLRPVERAVVLLHDVFGYGFGEIAPMVGKSEDHCRQLALRARKHLETERPRFDPSTEVKNELAGRFFAAVHDGNLDALMQLIARDAVVYGDGGGKAPQWSKPIAGRERVAELLVGVGTRLAQIGAAIELRCINGQPGALVFDRDSALINVFAVDIADGAVRTVRSVINPDKLRHLGPLADIQALLQQLRTKPGAFAPPSADRERR